VESERYPPVPRTVAAGQPVKILLAARFVEKKGICDAVMAFAELHRRRVDAHLTIVGDAGGDGASQGEKERILAAIRDSGVAGSISLRGSLPHAQLRAEYYDHHILLSPSVTGSDGDSEGGAPVTLIEASATGMPVVATVHADIPEVVVHGETGLLAPEHDVAALTRHLEVLAGSPAKIRQMGLAGARRVRAAFDADALGLRLEEIYDSILSGKRMVPVEAAESEEDQLDLRGD
jgi:colanic acid/amylovoran biosynthesis glycosyltransferase